MENKSEDKKPKEKSLQKNNQDLDKQKSEEKPEDGSGEIKPEVLEKIKDDPKIVREIMMGFMKSGPSFPPFLEKIDGEHITQALNIMGKELDYNHHDRKHTKWFPPFYVFLGVGVFIFLCCYFVSTDNTDLLKQILQIGLALTAGGFGGYGICEARHRNK